MTVFLPDTSVLIDTLKRNQERTKLLRELVSQGHSLASGAVTVGEIYSGMHPSEATLTAEFLSTLIWVDTTAAVARKAGELRYAWACPAFRAIGTPPDPKGAHNSHTCAVEIMFIGI